MIHSLITASMLLLCAGGCAARALDRGHVVALRSSGGITVDGRLDEPVWKSAVSYPLKLHVDPTGALVVSRMREPGQVRFAWDDANFYAAFTLVDADVVQENEKDQQHHYTSGDMAELFLKPLHAEGYWEFYVTPGGHRTGIYVPARGRRGLDSNFAYRTRARVAARVEGSANNPADRDHGWTAEIAIPRDELAEKGVPFDAAHPWTLLAGRYNYGCGLDNWELSSHPQAVRVNFHHHEIYPLVKLLTETQRR